MTYDGENSLVGLDLTNNLWLIVYLVPNYLHGTNSIGIDNGPGIVVASNKADICGHKNTVPAGPILAAIGKM